MSQVADLYKTLGISESAGKAEVKKAFRNLAKEYHPDTHPGDKRAEEKFKEISQAYEILSDDKKRAQYDQMRKNPFAGGGRGPGGGFGGGGFQGFDGGSGSINDLFEMFFGKGGAAGAQFGGGSPFGGFGGAPRAGQDIEARLSVSLRKAALGESVEFTLSRGQKPIRVKIPAGAESGNRLRLKGKGQAGPGGAPPGDLYLVLNIEKDPGFEREGLDITGTVKINLAQALLGCGIEAETFHGRVKLKVPAGTAPGSKMRLKGKGIHKGSQKGDHYVKIDVEMPKDLNKEEKKAVENMAKRRKWDL